MSINTIEPYKNPLNGIDPSRNNVNRIMNPPIRHFSGNDQKAENGKAGTGEAAKTPDTAALAAKAAIQASGSGNAVQKTPAEKKQENNDKDSTDFKLEFTGNNIMNGFILSELLGKPKILQKRRW